MTKQWINGYKLCTCGHLLKNHLEWDSDDQGCLICECNEYTHPIDTHQSQPLGSSNKPSDYAKVLP